MYLFNQGRRPGGHSGAFDVSFGGSGSGQFICRFNRAELPIMDGSAAPFVFFMQSAGLVEQNSPKKFIRVKRRITVKDGDKKAQLVPYDGFKVSFGIDFDHPAFNE